MATSADKIEFSISRSCEIISKWVSITGASLGCRDRDDDKFLETALVGNADYLVTGDKDLPVMSPFCNIPNNATHSVSQEISQDTIISASLSHLNRIGGRKDLVSFSSEAY